MPRVSDHKIAVRIEDEALWVAHSTEENYILFLTCGYGMDGVITQRSDKDVPTGVFDHIIGNGKDGNFFDGAIAMQTKNCVAIFVGDEQVPGWFDPCAGWTRQPEGKLSNRFPIR